MNGFMMRKESAFRESGAGGDFTYRDGFEFYFAWCDSVLYVISNNNIGYH